MTSMMIFLPEWLVSTKVMRQSQIPSPYSTEHQNSPLWDISKISKSSHPNDS